MAGDATVGTPLQKSGVSMVVVLFPRHGCGGEYNLLHKDSGDSDSFRRVIIRINLVAVLVAVLSII